MLWPPVAEEETEAQYFGQDQTPGTWSRLSDFNPDIPPPHTLLLLSLIFHIQTVGESYQL